jgi:Spy/CpxP family protein refolding chaperone
MKLATRILAAIGALSLVAGGFLALTGFRMAHKLHDPAAIQAMITEHVEDTLDDLDATPAQRTTILQIKDQLVAKCLALHGDRAATHQAVLAEWNADQPDAAKLHALVDQRIDAFRAVAHQAVDSAIQVHDTLTPAQRAKLAKKIERHHAE